MINFLSASPGSADAEEIIILTALPLNVEELQKSIERVRERHPNSIMATTINADERCVVELAPVNFRERIDHYVVHIKPSGNSLAHAVYQIEFDQFRSVKKYIMSNEKH